MPDYYNIILKSHTRPDCQVTIPRLPGIIPTRTCQVTFSRRCNTFQPHGIRNLKAVDEKKTGSLEKLLSHRERKRKNFFNSKVILLPLE